MRSYPDMPCALCQEPLREGDDVFATSGVWLPQGDALWEYCDAGMHRACYSRWEHRERFAASYFDFWVRCETTDVVWHTAFNNGRVLVTANPGPYAPYVCVLLRATGDRFHVDYTDWFAWLTRTGDVLDPVLAEALLDAREELKAVAPDPESLLARIDWARKQPVIDAAIAAEQTRRRESRDLQRYLNHHNAACNRLIRQAQQHGLTCPGCGTTSHNYLLVRRPAERSAVRCMACRLDLPIDAQS